MTFSVGDPQHPSETLPIQRLAMGLHPPGSLSEGRGLGRGAAVAAMVLRPGHAEKLRLARGGRTRGGGCDLMGLIKLFLEMGPEHGLNWIILDPLLFEIIQKVVRLFENPPGISRGGGGISGDISKSPVDRSSHDGTQPLPVASGAEGEM